MMVLWKHDLQGFTDQRLGKIPTSSPTASRRSRQIFLSLAASLGFQTHKGDVKCAFLQGDLDEQRVDDDDDHDNFKIESAQPVSETFCEPVPGGISTVAIGASLVYSIVEGRVRSCQRSKKNVSSCCHRSPKHGRWGIRHRTLFVDFPRWKRCH